MVNKLARWPVGFVFAFVLLFVQQAQASLFNSNPFASSNDPVDVEQAFQFFPDDKGDGKLSLNWQIRDDYYLYRDRLDFKLPEGVILVSRKNADAVEKDDPLFGRVWIYKQQGIIDLQLGSTDGTKQNVSIDVTYQGCWDGGVCYPPVTKSVPIALIPAVESLPAVTLDTAPSAPAVQTATMVSEQDQYAALLKSDSLWITLGLFFLAGLGLSFTPCVFPMIPILSSVIAGQGANTTTKRSFILSLVYVLSVAVTYTVAGVIAGLFGENLQAAFQNPVIIAVFSAVFVLLALSMFGFYQLQLPASWQSWLSSNPKLNKGGSLWGVAVMGLLSALIVGPCMAAPLAGALIYIGQTGDPVLGGLALFSLSMGMGVPLLIVGISAGKLLPKAGGWMDAVKAGFGVMLLALAIWMLDRIVSTTITMSLAAVLLIVTAVYMSALDKLPEGASGWRKFWKGVAVVLLVYGAALAVGVFSGSQSFLTPLNSFGASNAVSASPKLPFQRITKVVELDKALADAKQAGQPVMLDFYADWCISCVELDEFTFKKENVKTALQGYQLIKVDVTANGDDAKQLYKRYQIIGPPALVFFDQTGLERRELMLVGFIKADDFVSHIQAL